MKKVFTLVFVCFSLLRVGAQSLQPNDSLTSQFNNPEIGDYITVPLLWSCEERVRADAAKALDDYVVATLKHYPNLIFQIESHSDCRGDSLHNRQFTQRRADSLLVYILNQDGINSSQISAVGMGEDDLIIKECQRDYFHICTEEHPQLNRRTLLRVIGRKEN